MGLTQAVHARRRQAPVSSGKNEVNFELLREPPGAIFFSRLRPVDGRDERGYDGTPIVQTDRHQVSP